MADPSSNLLAASAGDSVKLFDVTEETGDPCTLIYSPSPGHSVRSIKWNHTNLVVASAGDDKKISLWLKTGHSMGSIPVQGNDTEDSIMAISFSNKGSRYICSGGTGQVVRIWDLRRKRCIKRLGGHTDTITGVMYNCKDEHVASVSLNGDLILHNLASGAITELKDPNDQVLRMLDCSRISRHLAVTSGDAGSVHLWDITGRSPKASWLAHSSPTAGVSFSPSNDKIIASVGLDKKLYIFDASARRPSFCVSYEATFSSLAFSDDGLILAAGTSNGRVVFYDVRGKPQPFTVLRAYANSETVSSLCWQRLKPVIVNESNCTAETALLGGFVEDSILMPDPLPSMTSTSMPQSTTLPTFQNPVRSEASSISNTLHLFTTDDTRHRNHLQPGNSLPRLNATHSSYTFKDEMEVFSPLVDVQPITPSLWDDHEGIKKTNQLLDKKSSIFPSSIRTFPFTDDGSNDLPIFNWNSSSISRQDDIGSPSFSMLGSTPTPSSMSDDPSITPPEAWGGEKSFEKFSHRLPGNFPSRSNTSISGSSSSSSMFSGIQEFSVPTYQSMSSLTSGSKVENDPISFVSRALVGPGGNLESLRSSSLILPRKISAFDQRISATPFSNDATSDSLCSPKTKKTGAETMDERLKNLLSRCNVTISTSDTMTLPSEGRLQPSEVVKQTEPPQGTSFTLQLFQQVLEEKLSSFQGSIHEDIRNLHIDILRQFHIQEMETCSAMKMILENQRELMEEIKSLRKENQQLRQLL